MKGPPYPQGRLEEPSQPGTAMTRPRGQKPTPPGLGLGDPRLQQNQELGGLLLRKQPLPPTTKMPTTLNI